MQETNNFTNLTRLSSFLLLDMLLLIDMTWNTHLSSKNTERKRNMLGDRETREESIGKRRRSWTMLDLTRFRLMRRVAHGRSRSLACRVTVRWTSPAEMCHCTSAMTRCVFRRIIFFHKLGRPFFCFVSFLFSFSFSLFFSLERDCLLCAICDMWLRACSKRKFWALAATVTKWFSWAGSPRTLSCSLHVCRLTAVVYKNSLRLRSRHFFTAVILIRSKIKFGGTSLIPISADTDKICSCLLLFLLGVVLISVILLGTEKTEI